ncbi:alpha/beta fold hydrolase [Sphingomonas sp. PR090111-T3T-6A]|uniref:alpha/beta fold hydrolase n=1 Tax=Sphingomonas sp. PR090111-T3T-6A TaxID=685778 RepID=UPI0003647115|nr:alpha/beta hydrolase [Sphingomonas sp. PR090111-T3T-6A]
MLIRMAFLMLSLAITTAAHASSSSALADKYADNNGVRIHYVASGKGPLVVMIHGFPDYWATWKPLIRDLGADGYRTVAIDDRGYNLSDKPKGVAAYAMSNLVADVAAVIAAEGRSTAILVGHDWGAAIAWQVAIQHPELVNRLVILSVPHPSGLARELANNKAQQASSQYARNFQEPGSETHLTAEKLAAWVKNPTERKGYIDAFERSDFTAMMNYYRANYPKSFDEETPVARIDEHDVVKCPVLVIHGMKDQALLAAGHSGTWEHVTEDTTILMVPTAGHWVQHDAEALVDRTIKDWLDQRRN